MSGAIHAAAAGWWLWDWLPRTGLPETRPETPMVELDLAVFETGTAQALSGPTAATEASPEPAPVEPEKIALAPEPEPVKEPPGPAAEQAPEQPEPTFASIRSEPDTRIEPEITTAPEPQPPAPPTPKPESPVKRTETRPVKPSSPPQKEVRRQAPKPEKRAQPKTAEPKPPKRVEVADSRPDDPARATQAGGPSSAGATAARALAGPSGAAAASRSAGKAEAAYLAELQRAIARHQRFPDEARKRHKTGVTTLSFVVQGDGSIRKVRIAKSSGDVNLDEAAVQAMQRLNRFKPIPTVIGRQEWAMRVPIRFDLR
jgi:protein TonB